MILRTLLVSSLFLLFFFTTQASYAQSTELFAHEVTRDSYGVLRAFGDAEVQYQKEKLQAEQLEYDPYTKQLKANDDVVVHSSGLKIHAQRLDMNTQTKIGSLFDTRILMAENRQIKSKEVQRLNNDQYKALDVDFTTCPDASGAWHIRASEAKLDQKEKTLTLKHARFEFYNVPILYTPYWQHPLQRSSGLLTPFIADSVRRGFELSLPYYLAISPTWDATFTPHWISKHGLKTGVEWRHISSVGHEQLFIESIRDRILNKRRSMIKGNMQWRTPFDTQLQLHGHYLDDIHYLADFSDNIQEITRPYLQSRASLSGQQSWLDWQLWAQHQQDLSTPSNKQTLQIIPRLESNMHGNALLFRWQVKHQSTRFQRQQGTDGLRMVLNPSLTLPWEPMHGVFSTLEVGSQYVAYQLKNGVPIQNKAIRADRFSWENRMVLARISQNKHWRHTWEPVLRYDRVRAPDQQNLVNFDSSNQQLSMNQLLNPNHFSGYDRVEDVNRFSMLLGSRIQYKSDTSQLSRELIQLKVGFSYDFSRKIIDPKLQKPQISPLSSILGTAIMHPFDTVSLVTDGQYDHQQGRWAKMQAALYWNPTWVQQSLLYRFTDARFSGQETRSLQWQASLQLNSRWRVGSSILYDITTQQTQQAEASLRYMHPCWQIQFDTYRIHRPSGTATQAGDTGMRFQLEFKGLGTFGS
ncbi:MAG: LPS assembly protein LptD [Mariprofundaceae bacterium]|nr:LPS assembly protein LptD [Mariprofundaceae bacterium]